MKVSRFRSHYPRKQNKPVTQTQHSLLSLETVVPISYGSLGPRPCISVRVVGVGICRERKHGLNLPEVPTQLGRQFRYPKSGRATPELGLAEAVGRASRGSDPHAETRGAGPRGKRWPPKARPVEAVCSILHTVPRTPF